MTLVACLSQTDDTLFGWHPFGIGTLTGYLPRVLPPSPSGAVRAVIRFECRAGFLFITPSIAAQCHSGAAST
jgi:hypothetical protein